MPVGLDMGGMKNSNDFLVKGKEKGYRHHDEENIHANVKELG